MHEPEGMTSGAPGSALYEYQPHQQPVPELKDALAANLLLQQEIFGLRMRVQELERRNADQAVEVARINLESAQVANNVQLQTLLTTVEEREIRIDLLERRLAEAFARAEHRTEEEV